MEPIEGSTAGIVMANTTVLDRLCRHLIVKGVFSKDEMLGVLRDSAEANAKVDGEHNRVAARYLGALIDDFVEHVPG